MITLTANDLKTHGVSALVTALHEEGEAVISVRGKPRFVVLDIARFERLCEAEIYAAWQEAHAAESQGEFIIETAGEHVAHLQREAATDDI